MRPKSHGNLSFYYVLVKYVIFFSSDILTGRTLARAFGFNLAVPALKVIFELFRISINNVSLALHETQEKHRSKIYTYNRRNLIKVTKARIENDIIIFAALIELSHR